MIPELASLGEWLRYVDGRIRRATRELFYGRITLEFQKGRIVRIEVTESIKDPRESESVAPDPLSPVG